MKLIIEGYAMGMRLVALGPRLQQSTDAIRKAKQRVFVKPQSLAVGLAYQCGKKQP